MPPSGFVRSEVLSLSAFAESLLSRFADEVKQGKHVTVKAGIQHELEVINRELGKNKLSHSERGVLEFVKALYLKLDSGGTLEEIEIELGALATKSYE